MNDQFWLLPPIVVKVGGSLFDWPEFKPSLAGFLASLGDKNVLLVPGGGLAADAVRVYDRAQGLGEEASHWLALRALTLQAHVLARLLHPSSQVVEGLNAARSVWRRRRRPILDMYRFALNDERRTGHLSHNWNVTSDSLAARVALVAGAERLILLKSAPMASANWAEAGTLGYVDPTFASIVAHAPFAVEAVDLHAVLPVTSGVRAPGPVGTA